MKGYLLIPLENIGTKSKLGFWIGRCLEFNKKAKSSKKAKPSSKVKPAPKPKPPGKSKSTSRKK